MEHSSAVIYTRISYDRTGEGAGVERQETECRQLAARLGLAVTKVYTDNDFSATSGVRRPAFEQMLNDQPAAIITWAQDRLLRLSSDLERVIALNVPVHMVTHGSLELATPAGRAVARTVAAWSTFETEQKALRQLAANDQRAAKGLPSNRPGYGYRRVDDRDVVEPSEAAVVCEIARRVLAGESLRSVARDLNNRRTPSPSGAPWQGSTVRQLLLRASLAGLRRHRGRITGEFDSAYHPAILDRDVYDRLVALLRDPARRREGVGRPPVHLLSGIARCGKCGGRMVRIMGILAKTKSGTKRQPSAYTCSECHGVRRKQMFVDSVVEAAVIARLSRPDAVDLLSPGDPASVAAAREAIDAVDARLGNAADAYSRGTIDLDQLERITAQLRNERQHHQEILRRALPTKIPSDLAGPNVADRWQDLSPIVRRAVIKALMRVTILPVGSGYTAHPSSVRVEWLTDDPH